MKTSWVNSGRDGGDRSQHLLLVIDELLGSQFLIRFLAAAQLRNKIYFAFVQMLERTEICFKHYISLLI